MDLDTENRLAALLMDEARRLRAEADEKGIHAYLRQPKARGRPNVRFLTATVLGVQQANKAVEVDELWHARERELDLENRLIYKSKNKAKHRDVNHRESKESSSSRPEKVGNSSLPSSSRRGYEDPHEDGELPDEEIERFLNSRVKRGRGAVGSRMDEPGPYPARSPSDQGDALDIRTHEERKHRAFGPEKPYQLASQSFIDHLSTKTKVVKSSSSKKHGREDEHRKEERLEKKKKKRSKHRHRSL